MNVPSGRFSRACFSRLSARGYFFDVHWAFHYVLFYYLTKAAKSATYNPGGTVSKQPIKRGTKVLCNVGRARGMLCTVVDIVNVTTPTPSGRDKVTRCYDVRTINGNIVRRAEDKITAAIKGGA